MTPSSWRLDGIATSSNARHTLPATAKSTSSRAAARSMMRATALRLGGCQLPTNSASGRSIPSAARRRRRSAGIGEGDGAHLDAVGDDRQALVGHAVQLTEPVAVVGRRRQHQLRALAARSLDLLCALEQACPGVVGGQNGSLEIGGDVLHVVPEAPGAPDGLDDRKRVGMRRHHGAADDERRRATASVNAGVSSCSCGKATSVTGTPASASRAPPPAGRGPWTWERGSRAGPARDFACRAGSSSATRATTSTGNRCARRRQMCSSRSWPPPSAG